MNSKPEIRFNNAKYKIIKGQIKDFCRVQNGKSNTQDADYFGDYPFFIRSSKVLKSKKFLFNEEAVITIGDGEIGKVFHYINGKFDIHQRCYKITNFNKILGIYFYYLFSKNFYYEIKNKSAKVTVDSIRIDMIKDMKIMFLEDKTEQQKIGSLFQNIDILLKNTEKKIEKMDSLKNCLLQKMFPENNKKIPEIRFIGYSNTFRNIKLKFISDIFTGKLNASNRSLFGKYNFYTSGTEVYKTNKYSFTNASITVAGNGANVGYLHKTQGFFDAYQRTYVITNFKENINFIYYYMQTFFIRYISNKIKKGNIPFIVIGMLSEFIINLPLSEEQQKIGSFFQKLDRLIQLYKLKQQKQETIKKALLEKMFI
ncbi:restriction endonuclease subunit S [[Mycoplasma] gypis]|uniref:Restriction endonuclease subunit S n=1 Tax=[Mycoplasma] gypis TaxID=92404 RepID=A0ABZ2RNU0_9BACT|nr:restriction endonuclease subunit S [[Mycoplasma] gypis]MBN0919299.1 restriction endonuclease subunit S [[Mycoplasma] gypis]